MKPISSSPCTVPKVHGESFKKEVELLFLLGVLEKSNDSEWGAPSFSQPKPKNLVYFRSELINLNKQIQTTL